MTDHHSIATGVVTLSGPITILAGLASAAVALVHLWRLRAITWPRPGTATTGGPRADGWIEAGHVLVAGGMAVMFVGPAEVVGSWVFLTVYAALAVTMLAVVLVHPHCGTPGVWSCCAMLVVESTAMACMSGAVAFAGWPLRTDGALGAWGVALFAGACLVALVGLPARRAARTSARGLAAWLVRAFPEPVVPRGTRLIMSGGMVLMFLGHA